VDRSHGWSAGVMLFWRNAFESARLLAPRDAFLSFDVQGLDGSTLLGLSVGIASRAFDGLFDK
jgi:hypothetical protein